jgi:hypothetical protein
MKKNIVVVLLCFTAFLQAKVYDCFPFFNELELLRLRFEELYEVIDHFVIVESPISFTGKNKPLYFQDNAGKFDKYKKKIVHLVINEFPNLTGNAEKDHWYRESYSRDEALRALSDCASDDVIFISDVDEIPRAEAVVRTTQYLQQFRNFSRRDTRHINDSEIVCGMQMRLFMYSMNRENLMGWCGGSKAAPYWMVLKHKPWGIKIFHHQFAMHIIPNAGWHFNTMGGRDRSLYKWLLTGPIFYPGAEQNLLNLEKNPELLTKSYEGQVIANTIRVPIDGTYPKYFLDNLEYFRELGWIEE